MADQQTEAPQVPQTPPPTGGDDNLKTLYDVVHDPSRGLYSKSFEEFKAKYSTPDQIDNLYKVVKEQGLYSKSPEEFKSKYFSGNQTTSSSQTSLPSSQESGFQSWKQKLPKDLQNENDYDLRGLYKSNPNQQPSANLHFPDAYKKPNHITFSDESVYNKPGAGAGGHWSKDGDQDVFEASPANVKNAGGEQQLQDYFKKHEPNVKLKLPAPAPEDVSFQDALKQKTPINIANPSESSGVAPVHPTEKPVLPMVTTADQLVDVQKKAIADRNANVEKYNNDDVIKHLNAKTLQEGQAYFEKSFSLGKMTQEQYMQGMSDVYQHFLKANDNIETIKSEAKTDPDLQNSLLDAAKEVDPDNANNLDASKYANARIEYDAQGNIVAPQNAAQILTNTKKIAAGKLVFKNGTVIKPLDASESFMHAIRTSLDNKNTADWLMSASKEEIAKHYLDKFNNRNPDEPVEMPANNIPSFAGDLLGQMTPISLKQAVLGFGASKIPLVGPIVSKALVAISGADDIRKQTYAQVFDRDMQERMDKGENPLTAVDEVREHATKQSMIDFVAMSAMGGIPEGKFMKGVNIPLTPGIAGVTKFVAKTIAKDVAQKTPAALASALLLGSAQVFKNAQDGKEGTELYDGVSDQMAMGGGFHFMTSILSPLMEGKGSQKLKNAILQNLHKIPADMQEKVFDDLQKAGSLTPEHTAQIKAEAARRAELDKLVDPAVVIDEDRVKIADKIDALNKAREKLSTTDKSYSTDAAKEDIKKREEEIRTMTDESVAKSTEQKKAAAILELNKMSNPDAGAPEGQPASTATEEERLTPRNKAKALSILKANGLDIESNVGNDVEYNGETGVLKKDDEGNFVFDNGEKERILPIADKTNPTETLSELGIKVLPDLKQSDLDKAANDKERVGDVMSNNGNKFFISLANPKAENTVGDQVGIYGKGGKIKEVTGMPDDVKLQLINKFLAERGLPLRDALVKVDQPKPEPVKSTEKIGTKKPASVITPEPEEKQVAPIEKTEPAEPTKVEPAEKSEPINYRTPAETDDIMRQDLPKAQKKTIVKVKSFDPKTGKETTVETTAREAFASLKKQHKILDSILGCL